MSATETSGEQVLVDTPRHVDDVTVEFLSEALGFQVSSVQVEQIGVGVGMLGQLGRLHVTYRGQQGPATAILKLPTAAAESRKVGDFFRFYEREGSFYQDVAGTLPVRVPRCYWLRNDVTGREFALLLEDFATRSHLDQLEGVDPKHAHAAIKAVASLHAAWWESPKLAELAWLPRGSDPVALSAGEQYRASWPRFLELFGDRVPAGGVEIGERVQANLEGFFLAADSGPQTFCHGDYRADNLMFDDTVGGSEQVGVLDWQICNCGAGVGDIAYFLCQSFSTPHRCRYEADLVRMWYRTIAAQVGDGRQIPGYPFRTAWRDYRRSVLATTLYPVIGGAQLDLTNGRSRALAEEMTVRAFSAAVEHDDPELYPSTDGAEVLTP